MLNEPLVVVDEDLARAFDNSDEPTQAGNKTGAKKKQIELLALRVVELEEAIKDHAKSSADRNIRTHDLRLWQKVL